MRAFLADAAPKTSGEDEDTGVEESYGMPELGGQSGGEASKVCAESCTIILVPHGTDGASVKERRRRMAVAGMVLKGKLMQTIPKPVWASSAHPHIPAALAHSCAPADVSMAVWKVKRNRAAVLSELLTVESATKFVQDIVAGNGIFHTLPVPATVLLATLANPHTPIREEGVLGSSALKEGVLPPGFLDWAHPSNVMQEMEGAPVPSPTTTVTTATSLREQEEPLDPLDHNTLLI
jgi:hypothetical protein